MRKTRRIHTADEQQQQQWETIVIILEVSWTVLPRHSVKMRHIFPKQARLYSSLQTAPSLQSGTKCDYGSLYFLLEPNIVISTNVIVKIEILPGAGLRPKASPLGFD